MARQYIEPMLATRRSNAWADPAAALALRMPGLCAVCHGWGRGRVCADCRAAFAAPVPRCRRCALVVAAGIDVCGECLTAPPAFDAALAAVDYAAPWDRLVTAFKFHGALELAPLFAEAVVDAERATRRRSPRSRCCPFRSRRRGCASAATTRPGSWRDGSRAASRVSAEPQLLLRIRETAHQLALPPAARAGNVRGAFAVEPRRRVEIAGRRIAVVDDVMTTGSTAAELAQVLKQARRRRGRDLGRGANAAAGRVARRSPCSTSS